MSETRFTETEALLAALREDDDALAAILYEMTNGELRSLRRAAMSVADEASGLLHDRRREELRDA